MTASGAARLCAEQNSVRSAALGCIKVPSGASKSEIPVYATDRGDTVMVVPVEPGPTLQIGAATPLIEGNFSGRRDLRSYDVSPDGQRFLLLKPSGAATDEPGVGPRAILVQGWFDELRRLVPTP